MDTRVLARELFKWVLGGLQLLSAFVGGGKLTGWVDWLSGQEAVIMLVASALIGVIQTFINKPKVPKVPPVVQQIFGGLAVLTLVLMLTGCSRVKSALAGLGGAPGFTVITDRGDVIMRDNDGHTTVTIAPIYVPPPQPRPIKTYSVEK